MAGRPDTDNLDHDQHFSPVRACNAAKLENILFTRELHRRHHAQGISAAAFHPGNVATGFATESDSRLMKFFATNPGTYYEKHKPARRLNPQALDTSLARNLWERSEQLISAVYSQ
jgi:NAD(P)-dependent dehydrogenase (short-subunit alcohol dehydrogenase family)